MWKEYLQAAKENPLLVYRFHASFEAPDPGPGGLYTNHDHCTLNSLLY